MTRAIAAGYQLRLRSTASLIVLLLIFASGCAGADHVGSHDCEVISPQTMKPWFLEQCQRCQGEPCTTADCEGLPCAGGKLVARGCDGDEDCKDLGGSRCGKYTAPHAVCTTLPDNR